MGLATRVPPGAVTGFFVPKLYAQKVIDGVHSNLVAWDAITSQWRDDLAKGNVLYITKTNIVAATEVIVGAKAGAVNPFATAGVTLTIDQWFEAPVDIDYMTQRQTHVDMEGKAVKEASYAIAKKIDSTVCALFSTLNNSAVKGTDGAALTDDLLIEVKELLDENDVPDDGTRSLIVDPSGVSDMLKIDKLVAADYQSKKGMIENGVIGRSVYGFLVRVTNNLTAVPAGAGSYGVAIHPLAIASAAQIDKTWRKEYEDLHLTRWQAEALWGVIEAMDSFGIPFYTRKA